MGAGQKQGCAICLPNSVFGPGSVSTKHRRQQHDEFATEKLAKTMEPSRTDRGQPIAFLKLHRRVRGRLAL
jgi:hypothetical protein